MFKYSAAALFTAIIIGLMINPALANNNNHKKTIRFPIGCKKMGYRFDLYNVLFTASNQRKSQTVYFIHNISQKPVQLLQSVTGNEPYTLYINGKINPNRWSVFAVSGRNLKYTCTHYNQSRKQHRVINCRHVLEICEFPKTRFGTNHRGTYWLAFNQSRKSAVDLARFHGILLTDPSQHYDQ